MSRHTYRVLTTPLHTQAEKLFARGAAQAPEHAPLHNAYICVYMLV